MTVREIAKITGLSPATVSRVLKSPHLVKSHTKDLVMHAIGKSGYKDLKNIHILSPTVIEYPINEIITALSELLSGENVNLVIHNSKNSISNEESILRWICQNNKEGSALLWVPVNYKRNSDFFYPSIPTVLLYGQAYAAPFACTFQINYREFFSHACQALYKGGVQKLLILIDYEQELPASQEIERMYCNILEKECNFQSYAFFYIGQKSWQDVYHMLFQTYGKNFSYDGVISPSPHAAYSLITFFKFHKISIPADVALITYGYDVGLELMAPPISMIHPNAQRMTEQILYALVQIFYNSDFKINVNLDAQLYLLGSERRY